MKVGLYLYFVHIDAKDQKKIRALHEISKAEKTIKKDSIIAYEMKERERWRRGRRCHAPPATVGGCLTRLMREKGGQTCPKRLRKGGE